MRFSLAADGVNPAIAMLQGKFFKKKSVMLIKNKNSSSQKRIYRVSVAGTSSAPFRFVDINKEKPP